MKHIYAILSLVFIAVGAEATSVAGQWGTTDTSRPEKIIWPTDWVGAKNLRAQWFKIFAESPEAWKASGYLNHAKGEPPDNTYYLWRFDKPLPEGTKILIEGDFPHARMMSFQVTAPWSGKALVSSDGTGLPEIHLLDEDIVPDPGNVNPFLPGADRTAQKRHFHIAFELRDGDPAKLNGAAAVPPYRAPGNLRIGGTATTEPGKLFGSPKAHGPVVYMRMYLPDHYDPYGGVEPPVIRLQLPGKEPVLAPVSRAMPVNLRKFVDDYSLQENPALTDGLSVKEKEANEQLCDYARKAVQSGGQPGTYIPETHRLLDRPDGSVALYKVFQTPWLVTYFKDYLGMDKPDGLRTELPARYRRAFGEMGPNALPPGNDEHVSDHHIYNTYLVSAANIGPEQLLVFRGKMPKVPHTLRGNPVMEPSNELRYWNLSMHAGSPTRLTPVVNVTDETVATGSNGFYTIVIGRKEDQPAGATEANGITWRDWPAGATLSISMRIMSTASNVWKYAPQLVTWQEADLSVLNRNPDAVRERMGIYYPEARYMTKSQVEALISTPQQPGKPVTHPGDHEFTLRSGNLDRHYTVHVPPQYDGKKAVPVVIMLHGGGGTGKAAATETGWGGKADQENFIAVFPEASAPDHSKPANFVRNPQLWNDGSDRFYSGQTPVNDVAFINAVLDDLERRFAVDTQRVYLTGFSNGAAMSFFAAETLSRRIAAIAPASSTCWNEKPQLERPVPMCYITGANDPLNLLDGGAPKLANGKYDAVRAKPKPPVRETITRWAAATGCNPSPVSTTDTNGVHIETYAPKGGGEMIVFVTVAEMGHTWAGGKSLLPERMVGKTSDRMDATGFIWDFFKRHPLSGKTVSPPASECTLTVDGRLRTCHIHLPPAKISDKLLPMVIVLHGGQMTGIEMEKLTGMSDAADQNGFIAAYPDAIGLYKGKLYWNDGRVPEVNDTAFISALIDEAVRRFHADPERVYVTGYSNGASMANRVGIELSGRIAAIAPVAGTIGTRVADDWKPAVPVPVLYFHGTADPFAYYSGGSAGTHRGSGLSANQYIAWWAEKNGCDKVPVQTELTQDADSGTHVTRTEYSCPRNQAEVIFYRIENGGHTWPGRAGQLPEKTYGKTAAFDANIVMWNFFKQHRRNSSAPALL